MKVFNTTAVCIPEKHYMVDLSERVKEIRKLVDAGKYFTISRARQYGKTTTIEALIRELANDYYILSLDFQGISDSSFQSEEKFVKAFSRMIIRKANSDEIKLPDDTRNELMDFISRKEDKAVLDELFAALGDWCGNADRPVIMIVDEADSATNNQVFLDFLSQLRFQYLERERNPNNPAFQSVILAGVTDVRHLKSKIRPNDEQKENSPWNIAAEFTIDMSLSETGIKGMLDEYEADHHTGMDTAAIARQIREYTNGYPFLVSRICQLLDERIAEKSGFSSAWTQSGLDEAIKYLLAENNNLFQSLTKNLNNYPDLKEAIRSILMEGIRIPYSPDQKDIVQLEMYGLIRNDQNTVRVANRIFETRLYNLFLSEEELKNNVFTRAGDLAKNQFVSDGKLNMRLILQRFIETYTEVFGPLTEKFKEKDGREHFLLYLKPIINGTGNYYIEAQTRNQTRTDVVVDYLGQQYILELKIWRGERYNAEGEKQISEYLDYWNLTVGYMLSFNFNKKKVQGVRQVQVGDKILYEGTV